MQREDSNLTIEKYYRLQRKDIVLFQFILEGYEGMASATTLEPHAAYIKVSVTPSFTAEIDKIIDAIQREFSFTGFKALPGKPL